jgi:hypothetical protein
MAKKRNAKRRMRVGPCGCEMMFVASRPGDEDSWVEVTVILSVDENDPWRLERLCSLVEALMHQPEVLANVQQFHDYKGELQVDWRETPCAGQITAVHLAWNEQDELDTSHSVNGAPLLNGSTVNLLPALK